MNKIIYLDNEVKQILLKELKSIIISLNDYNYGNFQITYDQISTKMSLILSKNMDNINE